MQAHQIYYLPAEALSPELLTQVVYPAEFELYWSDCWEPEFYSALAQAGFISTCVQEGDAYFLLPEMQSAYAVLDWENLHVSRQARRLIHSGELARRGMVVRFNAQVDAVLQGLNQAWATSSWFHPPYQDMMRQLAAQENSGVQVLAVELWSHTQQELVAGELGYIIGQTWTSLSGFMQRVTGDWNQYGTIQLLGLAKILQQAGFAFWNLGHPYMDYKTRLGACILPRAAFLERWLPACRQVLPVPASALAGREFCCADLFAGL